MVVSDSEILVQTPNLKVSDFSSCFFWLLFRLGFRLEEVGGLGSRVGLGFRVSSRA